MIAPQSDSFDIAPKTATWLQKLWGLWWTLFTLGLGMVFTGSLGILIALNQDPPRPKADPPILTALWERYGPRPRRPSPHLATITQPLPDEIATVAGALERLGDRLTILEAQFGLPPSTATLETRLATLEAAAQDPQGINLTALPAKLPGQRFYLTLPTSLVFDDSLQISPQGERILNVVSQDLAQYSGETIRIAAHIAQNQNPKINQELAYQLAQKTATYLQQGGAARWVVVGYGVESAQNTTSPVQRLEIAVD
ncbi:hypothetical protein VB712_17730 [Spirulina sp. CCNP1310]|uniref:OmpA family protein n=1 Tax=Spirulina sp. CCNP1310 TaxID=3110249 RepID=UPI002B215EC1|nr:hypothetical protein [Spirulina sp. CCNP1310]MEA5421070.1 hypothetical protein [Spirulina sp. CCNP1310]